MTAYNVRATLDRVLAGDLSWLDAARDIWTNLLAWDNADAAVTEAEDAGAWTLIAAMWDRDTVVNPANINYPWCAGAWTAEADARVLDDLRRDMHGGGDA